jgi:secreted PhoX family phosphatase
MTFATAREEIGVTSMDRRAFLARTAAAASGSVVATEALARLTNRAALADMSAQATGYGKLIPKPDQDGRFVLALPRRFSYVTFGDIGSPLSDGTPTPLALDGMAAFRGPRGTVRLIRNHEDRNVPPAASLPTKPGTYDPLAGGGTTTLDYDPKRRRLVRSFISLDGTTVNCAGGFTRHRRSWLTGEETVAGPANGFTQPHGYLYEVPADRGPRDAPHSRPLRAMGRFSHEAAATDHRTGIVYETEDPGSGRGAGFYRFIPKNPRRLAAGGRLQILGIKGKPQYDTREDQRPGRRLQVRWIDIPEPDPEYDDIDDPRGTFQQGWALGAAKFNRLEGCWFADGSVFFVSTSGGDVKSGDVNSDGYVQGYGQVWEYRTRERRLILHYESPGGEVMDSPDNLTVTPRGGLMVCEDDATGADTANPNRVIGISPSGRAFPFAENIFSDSELAGVCFSPDGDTVFVNLYGASTGTPAEHAGKGMTCAITGPWRRGPL